MGSEVREPPQTPCTGLSAVEHALGSELGDDALLLGPVVPGGDTELMRRCGLSIEDPGNHCQVP